MITQAFAADDVVRAEQVVMAQLPPGALMRRASALLATDVIAVLRGQLGPQQPQPGVAVGRGRRVGRRGVYGAQVVALVGPGNNGGDALFALAQVQSAGAQATAVLVFGKAHEAGLAAAKAAGVQVISLPEVGSDVVVRRARAADVVLDAIFGLQGRPGLSGPAADLVVQLTSLPGVVVAVDLPSGLPPDCGVVPDGPILAADVTSTFGCFKACHLMPPARWLCGEVVVHDIGLDFSQVPAAAQQVTAQEVARWWPWPRREDHKYSRGVVGIVAGSGQYPGAAVLAVGGALAAGAGMVRYVGPPEVTSAVLQAFPAVVADNSPPPAPAHQTPIDQAADPTAQPATEPTSQRATDLTTQPGAEPAAESTTEPAAESADQSTTDTAAHPAAGDAPVRRPEAAWVVGPGVAGDSAQTARVRQALASGAPVVADAGALQLVAGESRPVAGPGVVTPHAGELARMVGVSTGQVVADPAGVAAQAAARWDVVVVLKGAATVVAAPDGRCFVVAEGPAWLASAGAGDVLAGVIGVLMAQLQDPVLAAVLGVWVHGRAGCLSANGGPIQMTQLPESISQVISALSQGIC